MEKTPNKEQEAKEVQLEFDRVNAKIMEQDRLRKEIDADLAKAQAEEKSSRIIAVACCMVAIVLILCIGGLIWKSIDTPDPAKIAGGTKIDCVVEKQ